MGYPLNPEPDDFFYGDADIETAELRATAYEYDAARKRGQCPHTATGLTKANHFSGPRKCGDCGRDDLPADHWPGDRNYWGPVATP